jgi:type VI secretion system protein ImpJ
MDFLPVHWEEGMFLRPHHFQAAQRHWLHRANRGEKWDLHYNWGIHSIKLNLEALANFRFELLSLGARLRDGTLVSIPEECSIPALDLKPVLEGGARRRVFIGVPAFNPSRNNIPIPGQDGAVRYSVDTLRFEDENTGVNPQSISFRRMNVKLLLDDQDHSGYEVIPIARLERSARAEAVPQLDDTYFPPVLSCNAWEALGTGVVREIYDRVGRKIERLAGQVVSRRIALDSQNRGDSLIIAQLRELNEAYAYLGTLTFAEGVHPLDAYLELCRLVGQLSIFNPETRRPPDLPRYNHDDLAGCFYSVKKHIDALLDVVVEPEYKERPFVGAGYRMQVMELESAWLEKGWEMFIGVQTPPRLDRDECIELLTDSRRLDMKVGSAQRVESIYRGRLPGLSFSYAPDPTAALPKRSGLIYLQIDRDSEPQEWQYVLDSRSLAIRLNESSIMGNIQNQTSLTIKLPGDQQVTMEFTLFVVPSESVRARSSGAGQ